MTRIIRKRSHWKHHHLCTAWAPCRHLYQQGLNPSPKKCDHIEINCKDIQKKRNRKEKSENFISICIKVYIKHKIHLDKRIETEACPSYGVEHIAVMETPALTISRRGHKHDCIVYSKYTKDATPDLLQFLPVCCVRVRYYEHHQSPSY